LVKNAEVWIPAYGEDISKPDWVSIGDLPADTPPGTSYLEKYNK
jgi:hypothetical protein